MENSEMNLKRRTMSAFSLEALPGYRLRKWIIGPHLDYRWQGQLTSLNGAGGTNLKGRGYLIGISTRYDFSSRLFAQASMDAFGHYSFSKKTSSLEDDGLRSPLGIRLKSGYALIERFPNLSFDIDLQYLTFKKIHISNVESSAATRQFMASLGMTYQIEFGKKEIGSTRLEDSDFPLLKLHGHHFDFRSSDLRPEVKTQLEETAKAIARQPSVRIRIEGHTDSIGNRKRNEKLSLRRANSVRAFLMERGVEDSRISVEGFGFSRPVSDSNTEEGRALNRRVEIYLDTKAERK